jgi:hypothetical protein
MKPGGRWFSPGTPISSSNKMTRDIAEILLKVVLNTTTLTPVTYIVIFYLCTNQIFTDVYCTTSKFIKVYNKV